MFYEGDIQSGIATAIQSGKDVVCFLTDDGELSQKWENEWLSEQSIAPLLAEKAIALRIPAASTAHQQLSAFYTLDEAPALLVIRQGKVALQLGKSTDQDAFMKDVPETLSSVNIPAPPPQATTTTTTTGPASTGTLSTAQSPSSRSSNTTEPTTRTSSSEPQVSSSAAGPASSPNQRRSPSTSVSKDTSEPASSPKPAKDLQREALVKRQARQKQEAIQERERVRSLIEADKRERKAKEEQRRRDVQAEALQQKQEDQAAVEGKDKHKRSENASSVCSVQARLLDGTTIRNKFDAADTLHGKVRKWIDQNRTDDQTPYTFKLILTPRPSRAIDDSEEKQSLAELGLTPSASVALVPVKNFTEAYRASGSRGFLKGAPMLLYGYLAALIAFVMQYLRQMFGSTTETNSASGPHSENSFSATPDPQSSRAEPRGAGGEKTSIRIRSLRDQQDGARDDSQLYNGNTLNFEPKKDDEGKDD